MSPWYKRAFGRLYPIVYAHRDSEEAEAIVSLLASSRPLRGARLLDLASGSGRITRSLAARGASALGLDLSPHLIEVARDRQPWVTLIRGDMRWLPLKDSSFEGALLIFTSFGYFHADAENFQVLDEVRRILKRGGFLLLDLMNPTWIRKNLVPKTERRLGDLEIIEERGMRERGSRLVKKVSVRHVREGWREEWMEDVRLYESDQVRDELERRSLEITRLWGNYDGSPWGRWTPRLIILADLRAGDDRVGTGEAQVSTGEDWASTREARKREGP